MTDKQPEALSIAKRLKNQQQPLSLALREKAAAELRRLHEVNAELVEALKIIAGEKQCVDSLMGNVDIAKAALAAKEQVPTDNGRYLTGYKAQPEPPCKTGSQCIGGKCMQCAEQEPVAWMDAHDSTNLYYRKPPQGDVIPLYFAPPKEIK